MRNLMRLTRFKLIAMILSFFFVILIISVTLIGLTNQSRRKAMFISFSNSDFDPYSSIVDKTYTLEKNSGILKFEAVLGNPELGSTSTYIFATRDESINQVRIEYSLAILPVHEVNFTITLSDSDGNNETILDNSLAVLMGNMITYSSSSDIFIKKVDINYVITL